jgi:asparagine synthetase B (glutamine-hydrolysing)
MRGLAFESLRSEITKSNSLPTRQRAALWSCNTDRRLYQYYTVFHRSHVEQRFPFYNYRYLEFIHALPPAMLFERKLRRAVISKMTPTLASIPYDRDELPVTRDGLPRAVAKLAHQGKNYIGRRMGLSMNRPTLNADYENWLRAELRAWGENLLLGKQSLERDLFDPQFLGSLWRRHQSGLEANFIGKIAPLMTLEMLLRRFYDA